MSEVTTVENFQKVLEDMNPQTEEIQWIPSIYMHIYQRKTEENLRKKKKFINATKI